MYDKWVAHTIPWNDPSVKTAFQMFGAIARGNHYINGAPQAILATNFQPASFWPLPIAARVLHVLSGRLRPGFITTQFKNAKPGTDFNFFPFPTINDAVSGRITGGADVVVAMKDNNSSTPVGKISGDRRRAVHLGQARWLHRGEQVGTAQRLS